MVTSNFPGYFDLQNDTCFLQVDTQLFCVQESCIQGSYIPLLICDLHRFLCRLEKGRILDVLCVLNKGDSMAIFKQVPRCPSMNLWDALSHLCVLPRVFNAFPQTEALFASVCLIQRLSNYQTPKNAFGFGHSCLFHKIYWSLKLTKLCAKEIH